LKRGLPSRNERRKTDAADGRSRPGPSIINSHAVGIDVGNESHFVAVPPAGPEPGAGAGLPDRALQQMAEWLFECGIETVALQSTGVYWIALYDMLEQHGSRVVLVITRDTRNVPGRKTDVQECYYHNTRSVCYLTLSVP
jgi:transposase